jgi:hypothetical protein
MKRLHIALICLLFLIVLINFILVFSLLHFYKPVMVKNVDVTYIVGGSIGFDVNTTALTFGKMPRGSSSMRSIKLDNTYDFPVRAVFIPAEDVKDLLTLPPTLYMSPHSSEEVAFVLTVPLNYSFGNYSSSLSIVFYRSI